MLHPHHLHATAATWSLHTARTRLHELARAEAAQIAAERLAASDGLRSPTYGCRHASGGHSDPVSALLLTTEQPPRANRWAELADRADHRITGLARMLHLADNAPLTRIRHAIPQLLPATARIVARHLQDEDAWIRNATGLQPARELLPGVECPHCGERQLYVQTAGPVDAWTVICATGRLCVGQGCRCGMPGKVEGVAHIWPRAAVLAGVASETVHTTAV